MSLPARTLRSWVQIPAKAWMSVFILCLYCPVCVGDLHRTDPPSMKFYQLSKIKKLKCNEAFHRPMLQVGATGIDRILFVRWDRVVQYPITWGTNLACAISGRRRIILGKTGKEKI
jgi:hypothetical protein